MRTLIIGGGVIGNSIASFLSSCSDYHGSVSLVEKDNSLAKASSSLSAGGIRQQFSSVINIKMSQYSCDFIRNINKHLAAKGHDPQVDFVELAN